MKARVLPTTLAACLCCQIGLGSEPIHSDDPPGLLDCAVRGQDASRCREAQETLRVFYEGALQGNAEAQIHMADAYANGFGGVLRVDRPLACAWWMVRRQSSFLESSQPSTESGALAASEDAAAAVCKTLKPGEAAVANADASWLFSVVIRLSRDRRVP